MIIRDVLRACNVLERKTAISRKANVELTRLQPILDALINAGLIEGDNPYILTEEGKRFLNVLERLCGNS